MKILTYKNYLSLIKKSADSKMFQNIYILENKKEKDILEGGKLSCAYYVSCILKIFNLINQENSPHAGVNGLLRNMFQSGWKETKNLKEGNIILWDEKRYSSKSIHYHVGFYLGNNKAISNSGEDKIPKIHHYTYNNKRKIVKIFTHKIVNMK